MTGREHQPHRTDSLSTGKYANNKQITDNPQYCLIGSDVTDIHLMEPLVAEADHIDHLAAAVGV